MIRVLLIRSCKIRPFHIPVVSEHNLSRDVNKVRVTDVNCCKVFDRGRGSCGVKPRFIRE